MIDIHSHLLYGIDDGSRSLESSIKMLEAAAKDGVTSIVLTPHFFTGISEEIQEKIKILRPEAAKFNIKLFSGCEYDFSHLIKRKELITLGEKGNFVLVDCCLSFLSPMAVNILYDWQAKGYQIILAHPERLFCMDDLPTLKDLVDNNICLQLNAGSFRGDYGRDVCRFAKTLVKEGLCHFIASDSHSVKNYAGQIPACRKYIAKRLGTELEKVFFEENPKRMLDGKPLVAIWL
jgi:protein-tyrosine phosphatase